MAKTPDYRPRLNNQIRAPKVQVIGPEGEKLGVLMLHEALQIAQEKNLDVVEINATSTPPLVKILDYGKYLYQKERREKNGKAGVQEVKTVRVGFRTEAHDLQVRSAQADKFLKKGHRVKIEMKLRGREKGMVPLGRTKLATFTQFITEPFEKEGDIKGFPGGISVLIKPVKK